MSDKLVQKDPNNQEYAVRLAETRLWSGDCARAAKEYEALLTADFDRPALWWGFVDAAAVKGRPLVVYFSYDREARDALPWLTDIRWQRLGSVIH